MSHARIISLTCLAMIAFAGNSLLCRQALKHTAIDPASFTAIRLISGALMLWLLVRMKQSAPAGEGGWASSFALLGYAIWYTVLPALKNTSAATVQLSVPVIAALGGIVFRGEPITLRLVLASVAILGGIALVIVQKR
ncbi:MAG: DMT family transporter [Xanthomonadales bacterium]|nr:DMT family transporter [Xanthomonadales bacterium]